MMKGQHLRWSYLSTVTTATLQLLAAITLTRFLQPSDYGLAALALVCTNLTAYVSQLGVGRALVQQASVTQENIRAAFTLALAAGVPGTILLYAIAPFIAKMLHDERLTPVICVLSLNLLFQSTALVTGGLLRRELRIRALTLCDAIAYALSTFGIGLPLAVLGYGVWALVASTVSQSVIQSICYFIARPHPITPVLHLSAYRKIASFSSKASITSVVEACGSSLDLALIGKLLGANVTGFYSRSLTLSTQPCFQVSMGLTRVFAPALSKTFHSTSQDNVLASVVHAERQLMSVIFPLCTSALICAPSLVPLVFGRQWMSAVPVYRVLCVVAAFDSSFDIPAMYLEIVDEFKAKLLLQTGSFVVLFLAILIVGRTRGLMGVAVVYACVQVTRSLCFHWISARSLGVEMGILLTSWMPGIVCSGAVGFALLGIQHGFSSRNAFPAIVSLFCSALCVPIISACVYYFVYTTTVFQSWSEVFRGRTSFYQDETPIEYPGCSTCVS